MKKKGFEDKSLPYKTKNIIKTVYCTLQFSTIIKSPKTWDSSLKKSSKYSGHRQIVSLLQSLLQ